MTLKHALLVGVLAWLPTTAEAQVPMQTDQLDQHADIVRQRILRDRTIGRGRPAPAGEGGRATSRQVAACASKARFRAQYGADNAKVLRLYSLCRGVGL